MLFGRPNIQECSQEQWHKATGLPSFRLRVTCGVNGFMQSTRMPYALAELGQDDLRKHHYGAQIVFDPE